MKMLKSKKLLGFTLIELLIVIAIIGILAVAFLPALLGAPAKGRDAQRLTSIQKIENFFVTEILRPGVTLPATGCIDPAGADGTIGALVAANVPGFGGKYPLDPQIDNVTTGAVVECTGQYGYIEFAAAGHKYTAGVYARVENTDNGNIKCADVKDVAAPAIPTAAIVWAAADTPCYLVLIQ